MNSDRLRSRGRLVVGLVVCAALLVTAGTVWAATAKTITGTARNDTLVGTAGKDRIVGLGGNDKLVGKGGNDVLLGGAGNDTLSGGPGNDLLVGGPGNDKISCGPGHDIARAGKGDKVSADCEVVSGLPAETPPPSTPPPTNPPPPPPPPTQAPVTAGQYQGQTQNGNFLYFTVTSSRTVTSFRLNSLPLNCDPPGTLYGAPDFGNSTFTIGDDGSFLAQGNWDGSDVEGDITVTHWDAKITAKFATATTVNGTILFDLVLDYQGTHFSCTSGTITWNAAPQA